MLASMHLDWFYALVQEAVDEDGIDICTLSAPSSMASWSRTPDKWQGETVLVK